MCNKFSDDTGAVLVQELHLTQIESTIRNRNTLSKSSQTRDEKGSDDKLMHTSQSIKLWWAKLCLGASQVAAGGKEYACQCRRCKRDVGLIPELGRSLEKEMPTHSSILAWEIPWTEEPGGLQSMESQKSQTPLNWLNSNNKMAFKNKD